MGIIKNSNIVTKDVIFMKGNFRNSYMNDAEIENVSGGMSTTQKVIVGVAALAGTVALAYGAKTIYNKTGEEKNRSAKPWDKSFWGFGKYSPSPSSPDGDKDK